MAPETVRSVPPWVVKRPPTSHHPQHNAQPSQPRHPYFTSDDEDDNAPPDTDPIAPGGGSSGTPSLPADRIPHLFKRKAGRKWDHLRSAEPVIVPRFRTQPTAAWSAASAGPSPSPSPWREFIDSARYPHIPDEESQIVDEEAMRALQPTFGNFTRRCSADANHHYHALEKPSSGSAAGKKQKPLYARMWSLALRHPLGPLFCRLTVLSTSIVALALAVQIFREEDLYGSSEPERVQIIVAIVVDVVALPYIGYITVDDYFGKPLGLRPPRERMALILTDLFFICFKSASTALGFEAIFYFATPATLHFLRALGAFELIGLLSWAMTLTINVFREIARLGG